MMDSSPQITDIFKAFKQPNSRFSLWYNFGFWNALYCKIMKSFNLKDNLNYRSVFIWPALFVFFFWKEEKKTRVFGLLHVSLVTCNKSKMGKNT